MSSPESRDEPAPKGEIGPSESTSRTVTVNTSRQMTREASIKEAPRKSQDSIRKPTKYHGGLQHETSRSGPVYLEPPPVVRRPPKIKMDSFSFTSSWFSWDHTEQSDGLYCARQIHKMYNHTSKIRLFGMTFSKTIAVKFSNEGVDSALETVRLGNQQWTKDRSREAKHRLGKYTHDQRKDIEAAAAARKAGEGQQDLEQKSSSDVERQNDSEQPPPPDEQRPAMHEHPYVVVGFMGDESVPKETLRRVLDPEHLFKELHRAHRHLRGIHRRTLSLKECAGFGIYECDPAKGYHREIELDRETERSLAELWRSYNGHKLDFEGRWLNWIHYNFNNGSNNPEDGRLTLEFKLRWSVYKVVLWGIVPVLLSLAIGFWYMYSDHGEVKDKVAIAEAAWVIASYIVTTSACKFTFPN